MEELLAAIAEATNVPAEMVERSAEARAKAQGVAVEDVLRAWSGGGEITAAAPVADSPDTAAEAPAAVEAPAVPAPALPVAMDEASIVAAAAEKMGMPESMVRRSAAARAKAQGVEADAVLMEWAGVDASAAAPVATSAPVPAAAEPAPAAPVSPAATVVDASIMAAAAEKMGIPEVMVRRSAAARAKALGVEADTVLMEWAGVDVAAAAPAPAVTSAPAAAEPTPVAAASAEQVAVAVVEPEVLGSSDEVASPEPSEPPDPFESEEEARAGGALPRWLAALFVLVPVFAIGYALFLPNGPNCGDAGSLAIDPVTGLAVNCDGSEFGAEFVDLFSLGAEIYDGAGCTACHGPNGGGIATFPAFTEGALLSTFPQDSCSTQVEWIALGTTGWPESTYGANEKPVGGSGAVMPGFESSLSSEEMAAVALYERVAFGGQQLEDALLDCGGESEAGAAALGE